MTRSHETPSFYGVDVAAGANRDALGLTAPCPTAAIFRTEPAETKRLPHRNGRPVSRQDIETSAPYRASAIVNDDRGVPEDP
jgi:hypothetical protein